MEIKETKQQRKMKLARYYIINHPASIPILKDKWVTDEMLIVCLEENPAIFRHIPHPSKAVVQKALELDGANIKYISKKERKFLPIDLILCAVESCPKEALPYVPKKYLSEELKQKIFMTDPSSMTGFDLDEDFLMARIEEHPSDIKFLSDPSEKLKCAALKIDPNTALYFDELSDEMMDIIDEYYPDLKTQLPNYRR